MGDRHEEAPAAGDRRGLEDTISETAPGILHADADAAPHDRDHEHIEKPGGKPSLDEQLAATGALR
jgi:hypothetical protein